MNLNEFYNFSFKSWSIKNKHNTNFQKSLTLLTNVERYIFEQFAINNAAFSEIAIDLGIPTDKIIEIYNSTTNKLKNSLILLAYK